MFQYHCLNPIAEKGLKLFGDNYKKTETADQCDAILVRSAKMHDMELPKSVCAVARAGAGVNNIPVKEYAEKGVVVFNTPGANANGVKELVLAGMLLASRDIVGGIEWVAQEKDKEHIGKLAPRSRKNSSQDARSAAKSLVSSVLEPLEPWWQTQHAVLAWKYMVMTHIFLLMRHGICPEPSSTARAWMRSTASAIISPFMCRFLTALRR